MIFGLHSKCCNEEVTYDPDYSTQLVAYTCNNCSSRLTPQRLLTPCCGATTILYSSELHCTARECLSAWHRDGYLLFMDPSWSWQEGVERV